MDILTQLKKQCEQVEVVQLSNERTSVEFEANQLKTSSVAETRGVATRVIRNGKLGFSASSDEDALDKLAVNALESASYGDEVPIQFPKAQKAESVRTYDSAIVDFPIARMVEIGKEILDIVLSVEPEAKCNVQLERGIQSVGIRNHTGLDISYKTSPFSIGLEIDRIEGDDILIMFDQFGTTIWDDQYLSFVRNLVEKLKLARKIVPFKGGAMPVLFSPVGTLAFGLPLNEGVNGKNVYKGTSPMKGKIGEKLFDEKLTVIDDGTIDGKFASSEYDDEGVPRQRNVLIENGVVKSFLYDLKTAARFGVETTGNASRGLFNPPDPSSTNFIIQAGETPLKEIIAGMDDGILVDGLLGLGQGNIISGAFSNPLALAFKIEKGEIVGRIKNASIAGNAYELLKNIGAVSKESEWVYSAFLAPHVLIPEMNVAAKG